LITNEDEINENQMQENNNLSVLDKIVYKDNIEDDIIGVSSLSRV
jgi:hypothetical protein